MKVDLVEAPEGWMYSRLGNVLRVNYGKALKESNRRTGCIPVYGSNGVVGFHDDSLVNGPAIIIGRKGTVGAVHLSRGPCWPIDTTYFVNNFGALDPLFVLHALRNMALESLDTSSAIPGLNRDELYDQPFPIPPLAEQKRIVAKVEELLARVNAVRERLARVPSILKRFRQSILAAACSGRLTESWRRPSREEIDSTAFPPWPDLEELAETFPALQLVPAGWQWIRLAEIAVDSLYGPRFSADQYTVANNGVPTVRTTDIDSWGRMSLKEPPCLALSKDEQRRFLLRKGDLLITRTGATIGKCALYDSALGPAIPSAYLIRFRLNTRVVVPQYALCFLLSPFGQYLLTGGQTAVAQPNVNARTIGLFPIPIPPRDEQQVIAERVEALFKIAIVLDGRIDSGKGRADKLTQAILAKAFRGELVPTEANLARAESRPYEPASALLGRIRSSPAADVVIGKRASRATGPRGRSSEKQ